MKFLQLDELKQLKPNDYVTINPSAPWGGLRGRVESVGEGSVIVIVDGDRLQFFSGELALFCFWEDMYHERKKTERS